MPLFKGDVHFFMTYNSQNILIKIFTVTIGFIPLVKLTVVQQEQELSSKEIGDLLRNDFIIPDVIYNDPKHRMKVLIIQVERKHGVIGFTGNMLTSKAAIYQRDMK